MSFFPLEDLPNEILLKILSLLDIKGVLQCGQSSKRLREISNDKLLWLKLNLNERKVPYGFIKKAAENGCEYLNLHKGCVHGGGEKSEVPWRMKYLALFYTDNCTKVLQNCCSLEKLAVDGLKLTPWYIEQICRNSETLRILSLGPVTMGLRNPKELVEKLFSSMSKCHQLTEVNFYSGPYDPLDFRTLVENLTPNILKLNLPCHNVKDEHISTLVQRCKKIKELNLENTSITNDSVKSIVESLNSLEKLDVSCTKIKFTALLQLKSVPTLKILRCFPHYVYQNQTYKDKIKKLVLLLPDISINKPEDSFQIASPKKRVNGSIDHDWFWEIRAKDQDLFPFPEDFSWRYCTKYDK